MAKQLPSCSRYPVGMRFTEDQSSIIDKLADLAVAALLQDAANDDMLSFEDPNVPPDFTVPDFRSDLWFELFVWQSENDGSLKWPS